MTTTKIPPHNLDAEEALIGAALLRPDLLGDARHLVDPSDFYKPLYGEIWAVMLSMYESGLSVDPVTIGGAMAGIQDMTPELHRLSMAVPSVSAWTMYADTVIESSRRRRLIGFLSEIVHDAYGTTDIDELVSRADAAGADRLIASRSASIEGFYNVAEFMVVAEAEAQIRPWLVRGLFRPLWRIILVAEEGVGKGTLMRQCALHIAAGRDPFAPTVFIEPQKCLYADFENPMSTVKHQLGIVNNLNGADLIEEARDSLSIWRQEGGIDLRKRRDQALFEAVVQRAEPQILFAGPLYKMFRRTKSDDLEQATIELLEFLDDLRVRYGFALMLEHHAPKAIGAHRDLNPFGSSALMRWPDFGFTLEVDSQATMTDPRLRCRLGRFRRDREPANWPDEVSRGDAMSSVAWTGKWINGR